MGGIFGSGSSAKQPTAAGLLQFSSAQRGGCIPLVYGSTSTWPFRLGTIAGLTGGNAGASRTIDGFTSGQTVSAKLAFLSPIQPGDQFQILPGCDRTMTTCINVFNNQQLGQSTGGLASPSRRRALSLWDDAVCAPDSRAAGAG